MHAIEPARLKPDVTVRTLPVDPVIDQTASGPDTPAAVITGRALVFWDPASLPGTKFARKLDAIDTDQITPATDCVSESLDTLDERWKAGSFRYLMPDFRAVLAGTVPAIGQQVVLPVHRHDRQRKYRNRPAAHAPLGGDRRRGPH